MPAGVAIWNLPAGSCNDPLCRALSRREPGLDPRASFLAHPLAPLPNDWFAISIRWRDRSGAPVRGDRGPAAQRLPCKV